MWLLCACSCYSSHVLCLRPGVGRGRICMPRATWMRNSPDSHYLTCKTSGGPVKMLHTQSEHRCTPVKTPAFLLSLSAWLNLGPFFPQSVVTVSSDLWFCRCAVPAGWQDTETAMIVHSRTTITLWWSHFRDIGKKNRFKKRRSYKDAEVFPCEKETWSVRRLAMERARAAWVERLKLLWRARWCHRYDFLWKCKWYMFFFVHNLWNIPCFVHLCIL